MNVVQVDSLRASLGNVEGRKESVHKEVYQLYQTAQLRVISEEFGR